MRRGWLRRNRLDRTPGSSSAPGVLCVWIAWRPISLVESRSGGLGHSNAKTARQGAPNSAAMCEGRLHRDPPKLRNSAGNSVRTSAGKIVTRYNWAENCLTDVLCSEPPELTNDWSTSLFSPVLARRVKPSIRSVVRSKANRLRNARISTQRIFGSSPSTHCNIGSGRSDRAPRLTHTSRPVVQWSNTRLEKSSLQDPVRE